MRSLILGAVTLVTAFAAIAPSAIAQSGVIVEGDDVTLTGDQLIPIMTSTSGNTTYGIQCTHLWSASFDEAGEGLIDEAIIAGPGSGSCGTAWKACGTSTADWPINIDATGLLAPEAEFTATIDVCMNYWGLQYTGSVTADIESGGDTLRFDEAYLQNQSPPPGAGGIVPAFGLDGTLDVEGLQVQAQ